MTTLPHAIDRRRELRRHPRKAFHGTAKILVQGSAPAGMTLSDISKGGLGALVAHPIPVRHSCVIALEVFTDDKLRKVNVWGTIVYCHPNRENFRVGIRYIDSDTMSKVYLAQICDDAQPVAE